LASEGRSFDAEGFVDYLEKLVDACPIFSIEDFCGTRVYRVPYCQRGTRTP
jgi:hypothetical protein